MPRGPDPPVVVKGGLPRGAALPIDLAKADMLYHFSEEPDIKTFVPRAVASNPESEPLVWAIDAEHAPLYYFPRDCPRVAYWALPTSTPQDIEQFFGHTAARWVIAIEGAWLERMRTTPVYAYHLAPDAFVELRDSGYGCHVSRETITPLAVEPVGDLMTRLRDAHIELRITPALWPLRSALLDATLHFSMIRMRNATPPEDNTVTASLTRGEGEKVQL
jgi:hypothetical protein